eukprot:jgi/Chrpa1/27218/Chrysochromulina_OHIO_Genome00010383-RA
MPNIRARMSALRATSTPPRSSRGSGSVYPSSLALLTTSENGRPSCKPDITYPSVPEKEPEMRETGSAAPTTRPSAAITGSPAPTVASYRKRAALRGASASFENSDIGRSATGFLFDSTARTSGTPSPPAHMSRAGTVASVPVQSTRMQPGDAVAHCVATDLRKSAAG